MGKYEQFYDQVKGIWNEFHSVQKVAELLDCKWHTARLIVRQAFGLCNHCYEPRMEGYSVCQKHLGMTNKSALNRYHRYKNKGVCVKCGKRSIYRNVYCENCYSIYQRNAMKYHHNVRYGGYRQDILDRDNHSCVLCGKQVTPKNVTVHRIDGKNHGKTAPDETSPSDFVTLCRHCHVSLHTLLDGKPNRAIRLLQFQSPFT